jgi:ionotropic glutamate receptor
MESKKPSVFTSSYSEGIRRVLEGNYAFLMESTTIEYVVKQNCNLTQVYFNIFYKWLSFYMNFNQIGGLLDSKDFGIGLPIGSPWRDKISLSILEMQELGVIQQERNKWWGQKSKFDPDTENYCNDDYKKEDTKASALGVDNIGKN